MRVSVVIPCYNAAPWVERAVASIWNQEVLPVDICLVDNNSQDSTWDVLQSLEKKHPNLVKVIKESRPGASIARNAGARTTQGEWIQFLDADDELLPGKWARQLALAQEKEMADVVLGTPLEQWPDGTKFTLDLWEDNWRGVLHGSHCGQTSANLYHREKWREIGGWKEELQHAQDTDLLSRLLIANAKIVNDNQVAAIYHWGHAGQLTASHPPLAFQSHVEVKIQTIAFLKSERPEYWSAQQAFIYAALYSQIRMLASYDEASAAAYYNACIPDGFKLEKRPEFEIPELEIWMINRFGVKNYAVFKNTLKRFFPKNIWESLQTL